MEGGAPSPGAGGTERDQESHKEHWLANWASGSKTADCNKEKMGKVLSRKGGAHFLSSAGRGRMD